jgi:outer membrane protein
MTPRSLVWIPVCLLVAATASAQETLTLSDATARALAKNPSIRIERESVAGADARMSGARGAYDPQLRFDLAARRRRDPNTSLFSGAPDGEESPTATTIGASLSVSKLFASGATATVYTAMSRETTNSSLSLFQPAYLTSLGVDLRQPLLRNRAIDPARAALQVTALDRQRSGAALDAQVLQTVSEVEAAYWTLVAARRGLDVRRDSVALAERQRDDTQIRIAAGTLSPADLSQSIAELERRRGDLFAAQEEVARAERALKELMLDSARDPLWDAAIVPADAPDTAPIDANVTAAIAQALQLRPEVHEFTTLVAQRGVAVSLAENDLRPSLDVVGSYALRGLSGSQNPQALPLAALPATAPSSLLGTAANSWLTLGENTFPDAGIGIVLDIPLGRHAARGAVGDARASQRQAELTLAQLETRIGVEVRNAVTALATTTGRRQAARAGLVAAEAQLRAEEDRFAAGLTTSFFVLTRQNDLAQAQLVDIAALTDYRRAATEFARATGTLLRDRGIQVQ